MDAGDYRKADMSATLLDYRSATHDDYRRDPSARPEREQQIDKSVLYRWVLILLLQTCNALGFITVSPIMPFVQMQFFNKDPPNGPCKTDAQTDSPGCKARLLLTLLPLAPPAASSQRVSGRAGGAGGVDRRALRHRAMVGKRKTRNEHHKQWYRERPKTHNDIK